MTQYARPDSDTYIGVWTTSPLWSKVDEGSTGDSVRVHSDANPLNSEPFVVHLSSVDDPISSTGHIIRTRWEETDVGVGNLEFQAELRLGYTTEVSQGTLIATLNAIIVAEQVPQTDTYTLSTTECDAISDYTSLYMRTWCAKSGGGATPMGAVDFLELQVPAAGAAPVTVNLNEGSLSLSGVANDPVPGARILGLSVGSLSAGGVAAALAPGGITKALSEGTLSFSGQALSLLVGAVSVALSEGTITITGVQLTVDAGAVPQTITLNEGTASLSGVALDVLPGAFTISLNNGALTFTGIQLSVSAGVVPKTVTLNEGALAFAGTALDLLPGAFTLPLGSGTLSASGVAGALVMGEVIKAMATGGLAFTGDRLSVSVTGAGATVSLGTGALTISTDTLLAMVLAYRFLTLCDREVAMTLEDR